MKIGYVIFIGLLGVACDAQLVKTLKTQAAGRAAGELLSRSGAAAGGGSTGVVAQAAEQVDKSGAGSIVLAAGEKVGSKANAVAAEVTDDDFGPNAEALGGLYGTSAAAASVAADQSVAHAAASLSGSEDNYHYVQGYVSDYGDEDWFKAGTGKVATQIRDVAELSEQDSDYWREDYSEANIAKASETEDYGSEEGSINRFINGKVDKNAHKVAEAVSRGHKSENGEGEVDITRNVKGDSEENSAKNKPRKTDGRKNRGGYKDGNAGTKEDKGGYRSVKGRGGEDSGGYRSGKGRSGENGARYNSGNGEGREDVGRYKSGYQGEYGRDEIYNAREFQHDDLDVIAINNGVFYNRGSQLLPSYNRGFGGYGSYPGAYTGQYKYIPVYVPRYSGADHNQRTLRPQMYGNGGYGKMVPFDPFRFVFGG